MALTITNVVRANGPTCEHLTVTVNDEGVDRTFETEFSEIDHIVDGLGGVQDSKRTLILLWAAYRRRFGRSIQNVDIA
jgi:hypothetical protein